MLMLTTLVKQDEVQHFQYVCDIVVTDRCVESLSTDPATGAQKLIDIEEEKR